MDSTAFSVLILHDEPDVVEMAKFTLNHGRFLTREAYESEDAELLLSAWNPQIAVIDLEITSARLIERLGWSARGGFSVPVLALTRRGDLKTKLRAFELGVDDFMTIPFSPEELLARVTVILRRAYQANVAIDPVIRVHDIAIDILNRRVTVGESELHLTSLEQSLLYLLAANVGEVMTRDRILDALWGSDYTSESNVVDRHIRNLRAKLQNDWRKPRYIATVPGKGYRFVGEPAAAPSSK